MPGDRTLLGNQADPAGTHAAGLLVPAVGIAVFALAFASAAINELTQGRFATGAWTAAAAIAIGWFLASYLRDYLPQRAWLEGSVLTVARGQTARSCDLASAAVIRLRHTVPQMGMGMPGFPVLFVRQADASRPVRFTMRGRDLRDLPIQDLRTLAAIIEARPAPADLKIQKVVRGLRATADQRDPALLPVLDWSFRTDPRGTRHAPGDGSSGDSQRR